MDKHFLLEKVLAVHDQTVTQVILSPFPPYSLSTRLFAFSIVQPSGTPTQHSSTTGLCPTSSTSLVMIHLSLVKFLNFFIPVWLLFQMKFVVLV
jgi:hypothetical protein